MTKQQKAISYFRDHFNCSQAVFTVFGTENGFSEDHCLRLACGFGGGMGRQQLTCGAVTGAAMALGTRYGKGINDPEDNKARTYEKVRELFNEFQKQHGSTNCRELLQNLDMNDPDDYMVIQKLNLFVTHCEKYVSDSVLITEKLLSEKHES